MRWLELTVEADAEAVEAVSEILGRVSEGTAVRPTRLVGDPSDELALRGDPTAPYLVTAHLADESDAAAAVDATERALWHLQAFGLRLVGGLKVRAVEDDWTDGWRGHYAPQRIGRIVVVPSWVDNAALAPGEVGVRLDPGQAFGTGLHPTTRACLTLLQELSPMPSTLVDVGSGSGILTIAALTLGARRAVCFDTDPLAVDATRANATLNGLADRVEVRAGSLPERPAAPAPVPLVVANLVAAILVDLAPRLAAHLAPGGTLLASGIVSERRSEVESALVAVGLRVVERRIDGDWASLRLRRAASEGVTDGRAALERS